MQLIRHPKLQLHLLKSLALVVVFLLAAGSLPQPLKAAGAISLTTLGTSYTQDFNTLASSGTANTTVPTGWDFSESGTNANATYRAGTGSDNTGDTYSFGAASNVERAFGGLRSGTLIPLIGAQFTNNTGALLTSLDIAYTGEQWRLGQNTSGRAADRLDFQLSSDATSLTTGTWTDYNSLDFSSPVVAGTVGALNGNVAPNRTTISFTMTGLSIANGATFWIRWADSDLIPGADDGLSVDDFSLTTHGIAAPFPNLAVNDVSANEGNSGTTSFQFTVSLSAPASVGGVTFDIATANDSAAAPGDFTAKALTGQTIPAGSSTYTFDVLVNGDSTAEANETFFVNVSNVTGAIVTDGQGKGTVVNDDDFCVATYTPIYQIQGSGPAAAVIGAVTTRGVVVADNEGPSPALRGFYLQDATGDGDSNTSDGIFVFNGNQNDVGLGDVVVVLGTASEFQDQTQISASLIAHCGTGTISPVDVTFPVASADYLERYEGMLVRLPQTLYVTEHFQLGRFDQVVLSSGARLKQPTNVVAPGAPAQAMQTANNLNRIILDDDLQNQNPDPILFGRGTSPLSASNTLRGGDTATGIVGIMTYTWAGNAASGNAYRVRPINALGGTYNFDASNPRPASAPAVGGTLRVVGMNLLNFFNTLADSNAGTPGCFPSGTDTDCRGANSATEFTRQYNKTVAAILELNADIVGINEIENDGYGASSAIAFLVQQLNAASAPGTYAFIDVDANTGQTNAMGTDAIKVGMLYKPAKVTPIGQTAVLNSVAFVNGGDSAPRSRPSLAQAFMQNSNGATFVVDINHLKSKGSACNAPDAGDGQGNCNIVRTNAATELMNWLANDPTGVGDPDILMLGDYNSYSHEDPITVITNAGFTNLIANLLGPDAYSYVFDGQWGYLDYALGSPSIIGQITGAGDYHINSDEPSVLDYNTDFKSAGQIASLYAPDQFRVSDHDPVIVGLKLNAAPVCSAASASIASLWPSNHKYVSVNILGVTDADGDSVTISVTGIRQDEPVNGFGDGDTSPDGQGLGTATAQVRAERDGSGNGRVYHIYYTATDGNGGACSGNVTVSAPRDQGKGKVAVDDGANFDSTLP